MRPIHFAILIFVTASSFLVLPAGEGSANFAGRRPLMKWVVEKSSTLNVSGSSNVNSYNCGIQGYYRPDTIYCYNGNVNSAVQLSGCLNVDVLSFNCHNSVMTKDLRKTLKAKQYPYLSITFLTLDKLPDTQKDRVINGSIMIDLAGTRKIYRLPFVFSKQKGEGFQMIGKKTFNFSEFKLEAPVKLGGMIKVKDEFNVEFRLMILPVK
jgi:hypothetical protein